MSLSGRYYVVFGRGLLQNKPHRLNVVAGETPVALGVEVTEAKFVSLPQLNSRHCIGHFASYELESSPGAFMVIQNAGAREEATVLAVNNGCPMAIGLCDSVGIAGTKWCCFTLRRFCRVPEDLAAGSLDETHLATANPNSV